MHSNKTFREELPVAVVYSVFAVASWVTIKMGSGGVTGDWLLLAAPFAAFGSSWWRTRHSRRSARETGAVRVAAIRY